MNKMDETTNLQVLKDKIQQFRAERDWERFHTPKDMAEAISIEAGELLENFLWKQHAEITAEWESDITYQASIRHEFADVLISAIQLALVLNIDITDAVFEKLELIKKKYPVTKAKGRATKYTKLRDHGATY